MTIIAHVAKLNLFQIDIEHFCLKFPFTEMQTQRWTRSMFTANIHPLLLHRGVALFPQRPVEKRFFPCCCLAFLWRPIGMRSLVAAVCKNRKQSRQRGVKQIHATPSSVFSLFIPPASFLLSSLSFILPHTHKIRGLCYVLGKRVLLLLTKAKNSMWPTLPNCAPLHCRHSPPPPTPLQRSDLIAPLWHI